MYSFESTENNPLAMSNLDYFAGSFICGAYFGFLFSLFLILAPVLNALLGFVVRAMVFEEDDKFSIPFFNIIFISIFVGIFFGTLIGWHGFLSSLLYQGDWLINIIFFSPFSFVIFYCVHDLIYSD